MPTISCPKCQGKLRFPEDSPRRRVKCPTCGHVFQAGGAEEREAPAARSKSRDARDEDDRPRRRDDDDDYPRSRRSRRDEDDRPRRYRDRNDDEDDYDDERGRRRYRDDDVDDYDDRRQRRGKRAVEGQFNRASLACMLCFIGGWLEVGALGVLLLQTVLQWAEVREGGNAFLIVAGLLGLANLLVSATGYGFLVSGPRERGALGLSIATAGVAAFNLILILVIATTSQPNVRDELYAGVSWRSFVTELTSLPHLLFLLVGVPNLNIPVSRAILPVFASLTEIAKVIMFLMALRAIARNARDSLRAKHCMNALIANAIGSGGLIVVGLLFGLILAAVRTERGAAQAVFGLFSLVLLLTIAALVVWTTMVTKAVKDGIDYRRD